jgi:hypothetical protein
MFLSRFGHGLAAGAAGITALNAVTYLDMVVRSRPSSGSPAMAVERLAGKAGVEIPGEGDDRDNRLAGLGPLAGIVTGTAVGVVAAFAWPVLARVPAPATAALLGVLAMAGSDGPLVALGITAPRDWGAVDWTSDIVPHFGYGAAVCAALSALEA